MPSLRREVYIYTYLYEPLDRLLDPLLSQDALNAIELMPRLLVAMSGYRAELYNCAATERQILRYRIISVGMAITATSFMCKVPVLLGL